MFLIRHGESEFNRAFTVTRKDPGIRDPHLTDTGRAHAAAAARALEGRGIRRLMASPYTRALETAEIVGRHLDLPISVDSLIGERFAFTCDIGSPCDELRSRWPELSLDHLADPWWPQAEESEEMVAARSAVFRARMADEVWSEVAIVSHWGFIRALTGLRVPNGAVLRIDPTQPEESPEFLLLAPLPEPRPS